uniref:Uncharacterized protein n=1 Tax=Lepeophtheirus salmonis TaxID=72036 RepID=A0A0K2UCH2_LEPSM
MGANKGFHVDS